MRATAFAILASASLLVGCSRQAQQSASDAVDASTGLGAARQKIEQVDPTLAKVKCQALCRAELNAGTDLSNGPCLGNPIAGIPTWVCDVAHQPRAAVDNEPANQCSSFRQAKAKHFVEVDEDCNVIKTY